MSARGIVNNVSVYVKVVNILRRQYPDGMTPSAICEGLGLLGDARQGVYSSVKRGMDKGSFRRDRESGCIILVLPPQEPKPE